jgi:tryptophan 2,3-dioxygenase
MRYVIAALDMLEHMSPWEYTAFVRPELGHGSGFDSPGFREVRRVSPQLGEAFHALRREAGLTVADVYRRGRDHEELYQLAEALTEWDERVTLWRVRHFKVVERIIGAGAVGTQGTPVELLGRLVHSRMYPELWDVRDELTAIAKREEW